MPKIPKVPPAPPKPGVARAELRRRGMTDAEIDFLLEQKAKQKPKEGRH